MKYGTTLIVLGIVNVLVIFSGLPTGWKKIVIIVTSALIIFLGWMFRAVAKKKAQKLRERTSVIEEAAKEELAEIEHEIATNVSHQVEEEIDRL